MRRNRRDTNWFGHLGIKRFEKWYYNNQEMIGGIKATLTRNYIGLGRVIAFSRLLDKDRYNMSEMT